MIDLEAIPFHLLQTKLYPPRLPGRLVRRRQLIEQLDQAPPQLTLLSAPAGYGKSTLVTQWMESGTKQYTWLSLDQYDTDLEHVVAYLVAALSRAAPDLEFATLDLFQRPKPATAEQLAESLLFDLQNVPSPLFLVLDDYHMVSEREIHNFMAHFLRRLPGALHVILVTRVDPPLPLARQRGNGQLREVRGMEMHFTPQEASQLIEQVVGEAVDAQTAEILTRGTEGWPVGLRLVAMAYRDAPDKAGYLAEFKHSNHKIVSDYLLDEVLDRLTNQQRLLLLRTAIVDRFCAPLIDVLNEQTIPGIKGYDLLEFLWGTNLFLVALDGQGTWYRYHHLFRQLLAQQLQRVYSEEAIAGMHLQASYWFEQAGYIEDAILHALKAGESDHAAALVEKHVHEVVNQEEWRVVERWLSLLPDEARKRPGILVAQALIEQFRFRVGAMLHLLNEAQAALESGYDGYSFVQQEEWRGVINAYRATSFLPFNSPGDSYAFAENALKQVNPSAIFVRSFAEFWFVYSLQQAGKPQEALRRARQLLAGQTGAPDTRTNRLMLAQCSVHYGEADVYGLRGAARAFLDLALRTGHQVSQGWANFFLGWSCYQENDLTQAKFHFENALAHRQRIHGHAAVGCFTGLAHIHHVLGEDKQVQEVLTALREFMVEQGAAAMLRIPDSLALHLAPSVRGDRNTGDLKVSLSEQLAVDTWELPVLTACRTEILSGGPDLEAVEQTLAECERFALSRNNKRQLLQIGALQALLSQVRGQWEQALARLSEVVRIGQTGGALRILVDTAPELKPCYERLAASGFAPDYLPKILSAVPGEEERAPHNLPAVLSAEAQALLAELTNREMEVLLLLGERLSNKEIAARLYISPRTVKKHTINVYLKMDVHNRRQAVSRARVLGIITD